MVGSLSTGAAHGNRGFSVAHARRADGFDASEDGTGRGTPLVPVGFNWQNGGGYGEANDGLAITQDGTGPLSTSQTPAVAYGLRSDAGRAGSAKTPSPDAAGRVRLRDPGFNVYAETAPTLEAAAPHAVATPMAVRRLTPVECERLQGFPDDWTLVPYRGKPAADGNRYRALGNSMAVPCMSWLGKRIQLVEEVAP